MDKNAAEKLKLIDNEISNAIDNISEFGDKLDTIRTDSDGNILKDECTVLKEKFTAFSKSLDELTRMLTDLGIISKEDFEE